jgi:hypothetical protein
MKQIFPKAPYDVLFALIRGVLLLALFSGPVTRLASAQDLLVPRQDGHAEIRSIGGERTEKSEKRMCLSSHEVRLLVERGEVLAVHKAMQLARAAHGGEIVKARLCPEQDKLIYLLTVLDKNSLVAIVAMDARTGQLLVSP